MTAYFHGGRAGLKKGNFILPATITGAKSTAEFGNYMCDRSKVYVTTEYAAAAMYACGVRSGEVYEVEVIGELHDDPDCTQPGLSYMCEKARILKVHRVTPTVRRMVLDVLTAA